MIRSRVLLIFFLAGCFSQVVQALMGREMLVVFYGNETLVSGNQISDSNQAAIGVQNSENTTIWGNNATTSNFGVGILESPGTWASHNNVTYCNHRSERAHV